MPRRISRSFASAAVKSPNTLEIVGDVIPAGGFELGVARHRGSFVPVAFHPGSTPITLTASAATLTEAQAKLRLVLRGIRLVEQGR